MSLILQRKRTSSLSRDTEIKYCFTWKVFIIRQRHIEASFMKILKDFVLKAQKSPHHKTHFQNRSATETPGKTSILCAVLLQTLSAQNHLSEYSLLLSEFICELCCDIQLREHKLWQCFWQCCQRWQATFLVPLQTDPWML